MSYHEGPAPEIVGSRGIEGAEFLRGVAGWLRAVRKFARTKPLGAVGAAMTVIFALVALLAPALVTHDPLTVTPNILAEPSAEHLFGTDHLGRDLYSRVVQGARISITVGLVSVLLSTLAGSALGLISGYWMGMTDTIIMRLVDTLMAFPSLVLALAIMAMLGPSIRNVIFAIAITQVPAVSRVVRSQVLSVRGQQFIESAKALGAGDGHLLLRHILPNIAPTIIIYGSTNLGYAILTEGTLSFLGAGIPPPTPAWGEMLSGQARLYLTTAWWMAFFPIAALSLTILGAMWLGDAVRDVLDPRLRGSR